MKTIKSRTVCIKYYYLYKKEKRVFIALIGINYCWKDIQETMMVSRGGQEKEEKL